MSNLSNIIDRLAADSSTTAKTQILIENQDNVLLKEAFHMTLDPFINYFLKAKIPAKSGTEELTLGTLLDVKAKLAGRIVTGHAARDYLATVMETLTPEDQEILRRIINHDMECKVAESLANRAWPGLVKKFPVMLSDTLDENTVDNLDEDLNALFVQLKADGGRAQIVVGTDGGVTIYSRNGNILETHGVFDDLFSSYTGYVFDGELLVQFNGVIQERKLSNGIFNKAVRGTISQAEADTLMIVLWDKIPVEHWSAGKSNTPYETRFNELTKIVDQMSSDKATLIKSKRISTIAEAYEFYAEMIEDGQEGAMLKPANMIWEARRSKFCLKMKEIKDATLRCIAVKPHSKRPHLIGSLECITEDGLVEVSIGAGLGDEERSKPADYFVGQLIDMQYNALIKAKNSDKMSMFLPRYINLRLDQDQADTLEKLQ